jgi:hypothetical protein
MCLNILSRDRLQTGFGLVIGFIVELQNVPTNIHDSLTELHTQKISVTTPHIKVFSVFSSRFLVAASKGGRSPSSGFPICLRPQLQLLTSHNCNSQLTHYTD